MSFNYVPKPYSYFIVTDPKPREVFAPHFYDRIVQRWFVVETEPYFDKRFLPNAYAHRKGMGPHKAVKKLRHKLRNKRLTYYLKADIKNFFYSMHKPTLWNLLSTYWFRYIQEHPYYKWLIFVAKVIVFTDPTKKIYVTCPHTLIKLLPAHKTLFNGDGDRGLPLGNATSQLFAGVYLHELDRFIVHILKIKEYFRYVDDFVLLSTDELPLREYVDKIDAFLGKHLKLELHERKRIIQPTRYGIDFVGYVVWARRTLVRVKTVKRMGYRFSQLVALKEDKKVDLTALPKTIRKFILRGVKKNSLKKMIDESRSTMIMAYYGWLSHADTRNLMRNLKI